MTEAESLVESTELDTVLEYGAKPLVQRDGQVEVAALESLEEAASADGLEVGEQGTSVVVATPESEERLRCVDGLEDFVALQVRLGPLECGGPLALVFVRRTEDSRGGGVVHGHLFEAVSRRV